MSQHGNKDRPHGPENAEHELKKAYNCVIEAEVVHNWDRKIHDGLSAGQVAATYKRGYDAYRSGDRLAAERWARTAKHLARAFWHEAKLSYLDVHSADLPYLENAAEEYNLHERMDTTQDLLESVSYDVPPGMTRMPEEMNRYLSRARKHLETLKDETVRHELLRAEHLKAAHEYARVLECMGLAFEAENHSKKVA